MRQYKLGFTGGGGEFNFLAAGNSNKYCNLRIFRIFRTPSAGQILRSASTSWHPYFGQLLGAGSAPTSPSRTDSKSYYSILASFAEFKPSPEKFGARKRHI